MGQDEGGAGDIADLARAGGDVLEGAPGAGEQGEPAFAQAAQRAEQRVAGAGIDIELLPAGWLLDRDVNDRGAVVTGVSQGGQPGRGGRAERGTGPVGTSGGHDGDHVEPSSGGRPCGETLYGAHVHSVQAGSAVMSCTEPGSTSETPAGTLFL